jgi:hypothetical protein
LLRLYNVGGGPARYWTAWAIEGRVIVHRGVVGSRGETRHIELAGGQDAGAVIEQEAKAVRVEGFGTIDPDPERQIVVTGDATGCEPDEIAGTARMFERLCNECLGWTGNGYCDGPAYGHGTVSVFCPVVDRERAIETVVTQLRAHGCDNWDEWLVVSVPDGARFCVVYGNPAARRAGLAEPLNGLGSQLNGLGSQ